MQKMAVNSGKFGGKKDEKTRLGRHGIESNLVNFILSYHKIL